MSRAEGLTIGELLAAAEPADPRPLAALIERFRAEGRLESIAGEPGGVAVQGVVFDSRRVTPGCLFVAVPGAAADGHDFVGRAVEMGAAAVIVERVLPDVAVPQLVVAAARPALASAAAWWYGDPSRELLVIGITGTDGKTTTANLAVAALEAWGLATGLVSTAVLRVGGRSEVNEEHVTTPEAPDLQRALRAMLLAGDQAAIVETTSHGLHMERVASIAYDAAILTNVTHEHLELHGTFEAYRDAKARLFAHLGDAPVPVSPGARAVSALKPAVKVAVVNADDPSAQVFEAAARGAGASLLAYGLDPRAEVRATSVDEDARRLRIEVATPGWSGPVELRLAGSFNVHNALAVVALGRGLGLDPEAVRRGLEGVEGVPGRMERIDEGQPFAVIVDYAHSPAALEKVLTTLAPLVRPATGIATGAGTGEQPGLIAVFGSAGERDLLKRPVMGRIAAERCRLVVVTDEDPRRESSQVILDQIAAGAEEAGRRRGEDLLVIADRADAIAAAFDRARPGDVILLAGKGHERSIIQGTTPVPWDEAAVARRLLRERGWTPARGGGTAGADAGRAKNAESGMQSGAGSTEVEQ